MNFWKVFWPSLVATVLSGILVVLILYAMVAGLSPEPKIVEQNTVLHMKLDQQIGDVSYSFFDPGTFQPIEQLGLINILNGIERAKTDDRVKGIFLDVGNLNAGMATIKEIREALEDFQKSGKFLVAYHETFSNKSYYLASVANEIYLYPTGLFEFLGLGAEIPFVKSALDMLEVDMQIIRGSNNKFKSAVEPLMYNQMSEANREQTQKYLSALWLEILASIEAKRGITLDELNLIADSVLTRTPADAVKYNFITGTKYYDEIETLLNAKVDGTQDKPANLFDFSEYVSKYKVSSRKAEIAVISLEGDIVDGQGAIGQIGGNSSAELIRKIRKDTAIKALVLRVNSPGGSALASDLIWREMILTKAEKPVVVSMGDVAASGGYYISCAANKIYGEPNTITGSIGVFGVIPFTGDLMKNKLGISFDRVETNTHSVLSLNKRLTDEEILIIQQGVDDIYTDFITKVADGRNLTTVEVDSIGQGRVWAGTDAKTIGLIDEFGGLKEAIAEAAAMIGDTSTTPKVKVYSNNENDRLTELLKTFDQMESTQTQPGLNDKLIELYQFVERLENAKGVQARMPYLFWIE